MEETVIPVTDMTPDERVELENLRKEKQHRALSEHARGQLAARGISMEFAPFLLGEDEAATGKNIAVFERAWNSSLQAEVARRLPAQQPPRDFAVSAAAPARRTGIRRVK